MRHRLSATGAAVLLGFLGAFHAQAQESPEEFRATVQALKAKIQDQEKRLADLEARQNEEYLRKLSREETLRIVKEMTADAATQQSLPKWMENLKFYGDLRLRYEGAAWSTHDGFNSRDRNRLRMRLRFGLTKTWDEWEIGFRLATGEPETQTITTGTSAGHSHTVSGVPTGYSVANSTDQTFTGMFSEKPIWVDLAYAKYQPKWLKGLELTVGKMKSPFYSSDIVWDTDVNPEGVYGRYTFSGLGPVEPFVGAGYFVGREVAQAADTVLKAYDAGLAWKINKEVKYIFAASYYDWGHYDTSGAQASGNDPNWRRVAGAPLDWSFAVIDLVNRLEFQAWKLPMSVYFDWAHNCADDDRTPEYVNRDNAFAVGGQVGQNKKAGDWSASYKYAFIEANAIPGFFADSTFGGANRQGHVITGAYSVTDFLTLGLNLYVTQPIHSSNGEDDQVVVQGELVWKF